MFERQMTISRLAFRRRLPVYPIKTGLGELWISAINRRFLWLSTWRGIPPIASGSVTCTRGCRWKPRTCVCAGLEKWVSRWGARPWGPYEKGPKRQKGPQNVCKNSKLPKKQHSVSQMGLFDKISGLPRSLPGDKIPMGPGGDRSPGPPPPPSRPVSPALRVCVGERVPACLYRVC